MSNNYTKKIAELEAELNKCEAELLATRARCESLHKRRRYIKQKLDNVVEEARKTRMERGERLFQSDDRNGDYCCDFIGWVYIRNKIVGCKKADLA